MLLLIYISCLRAVLSEVIACIAGGSGYTYMVDLLTTWLQSALHIFQRIPRPLPRIFLQTRGGYGLITGGCRSVAGKPAAAAAARTRDAKHSSSAIQCSYLSTAPSPGPSPRDMGVHAPAGVYATTGGWAHRWPSRPHPLDLGAAEKSTQRPRAKGVGGRDRIGVAGEAATAAYLLPLPFRPPPRSARAIAERADYKSRLQALFC